MRMRFSRARAAISAGMMVSRKCSNGSLSRKKNVSLVVIASTTSVASGERSAALELADQFGQGRDAVAARDRHQSAFGEILLLGRQHEAGALAQQLAQIVEILRRHARSPANRRVSRGAISLSGSTDEQSPAMRDLAGHAPDHAGRFVLRHDMAAGRDDGLGAARDRRSPCR